MSERVFAFVEEWVSEHIDAESPAQDVAALTQKCIQDAQAAGVPRSEIDDAFENLSDYLAGQIAEAKERREGRLDDDDEDESDVPV